MVITLSKFKSLERKAEAMKGLDDDYEFWTDEELEQCSGVDSVDSWSEEQLREVINVENRTNKLLDSPESGNM